MVKTCENCAYRKGSYDKGHCLLGGVHCTTERQYPTRCGENFENWQQRARPSRWNIINYFYNPVK